MKVKRTFTLSDHHLTTLDGDNRSRALTVILAKTIINPHRVLNALHERLSKPLPKVEAEGARLCVTLPDAVAKGLDELTARLSMATEHVVRLAIEADAIEALKAPEEKCKR